MNSHHFWLLGNNFITTTTQANKWLLPAAIMAMLMNTQQAERSSRVNDWEEGVAQNSSRLVPHLCVSHSPYLVSISLPNTQRKTNWARWLEKVIIKSVIQKDLATNSEIAIAMSHDCLYTSWLKTISGWENKIFKCNHQANIQRGVSATVITP